MLSMVEKGTRGGISHAWIYQIKIKNNRVLNSGM